MNLYATPYEIKGAMPDGIRETTTSYDDLLYRLSERISRMIDRHCGRTFYPYVETRYFDGDGGTELWVPDLLEVTTAYYSTDLGRNYTAYTAYDYIASSSRNINGRGSYSRLIGNLNSNATTGYFPAGQRSVKIIGIWGTTDDRNTMWQDSGDTTENAPLTAAGTSLTVNDVDGADIWGMAARFQAGQLLKIGSEFVELTAISPTGNTATILRGRNGSTAAEQAQNTAIYIWRPAEDVKQACIIQAIRAMQRGFQGFADTRSTTDLGSLLLQMKRLDPEAEMLLQPWVWFGD
jgi:hypothetical protein